jgi:hypothetical protein
MLSILRQCPNKNNTNNQNSALHPPHSHHNPFPVGADLLTKDRNHSKNEENVRKVPTQEDVVHACVKNLSLIKIDGWSLKCLDQLYVRLLHHHHLPNPMKIDVILWWQVPPIKNDPDGEQRIGCGWMPPAMV